MRIPLILMLVLLAGCVQQKKPVYPPLSSRMQSTIADTGIHFVSLNDVTIEIGPTNLSGIHREYWGTTNNAFENCCPIIGVSVTFPTITTNRYGVEAIDSTNPIWSCRFVTDPQAGHIFGWSKYPGVNTTNVIYEPHTNTNWAKVSPTIVGNGNRVSYQFNSIHSNLFVRVRRLD